MGRLNNLGLVAFALNYNLTVVGKVWITVMIVFRLLVIIGVGYPLYQDEQARFTCDTMQPGCSNVCYDAFFPVSHCRFWFVQATALCLPLAMFVIYVAHRAPIKSCETNLHLEDSHGETEGLRIRHRILNFCKAYVLQLLLRTLLEVGFGVGHYCLFGFFVPNRFVCSSYPCANRVTCYPSRPTEKTLLANFMFGVTAFSFLLNFVDLVYVIKQAVKQNKKNKLQMKTFYPEESYHDIPGDTDEPPEHKAVQGYEMGVPERPESVASADSGTKSAQGEGTFPRSEVQPQDVALSNTNSNNTHLTVIASSSASMVASPDGSGSRLALCESQQGTAAHSLRRYTARLLDQPGSRLRQHTLQKAAQHPLSNSQLLEEYRLVHMRVTDNQSNCSNGSRRKKSEWV
ncbi:gap junction Cx32.7 protein [Mustelus asterias]